VQLVLLVQHPIPAQLDTPVELVLLVQQAKRPTQVQLVLLV